MLSIVGNDGVVFETASVTSSKSNVTSLTPSGTPGVSDLPGVIGIETNKDDSVISLFGISRTVAEDTLAVVRPGGGIDADGNRLDLKSSLQISISGLDLELLRGLETGVLEGSLALAILSSVGVFRFLDNTEFLGVADGISGPGTIATFAAETFSTATVDELLFREGNGGGGLVFEIVNSFEHTSGGESPAGTALLLVLDTRQDILGGPIDGLGSSEGFQFQDGEILVGGGEGLHEISGLEFSLSQVSELVDVHIVSSLLVGVVVLDLVVVFQEDGKSVRFFALVGVFDAVASLELLESVETEMFIGIGISGDQVHGGSRD